MPAHRNNHLAFQCDKLEDRVLFSAAGSDTTTAVSPTAPKITTPISSSNGQDVYSTNTVLQVSATDNRPVAHLKYSWIVESGPDGAPVSFSGSGGNKDRSTTATFTQAGTYVIRVDVIDRDGEKVSDRIEIRVHAVPTSLEVTTLDGSQVDATTGLVHGTETDLRLNVRDQFGKAIVGTTATWSVSSAPESSALTIQSTAQGSKLVFDRAGVYQVKADLGGLSHTVQLTVVQQLSQMAVEGLVVNDELQMEVGLEQALLGLDGFDQFGHMMLSNGWNVSVTEGDGSAVALEQSSDGSPSIRFRQSGNFKVLLANGGLARALNVKVLSEVAEPVEPDSTVEPAPTVETDSTLMPDTQAETNPDENPPPPTDEPNTAPITHTAVIHVSTPAELTLALKNAVGGELILLAGGVNFGDVKLYRPAQTYTSTVTVRSADAANRAVLNFVYLDGVRNLTFDNVLIARLDGTQNVAMRIGNSYNITLQNSSVTANLDPYRADQTLVNGVDLRGSDQVAFINNRFHNLSTGFYVTSSSNVLVELNTFEQNLKDNLNIASNVSDIMVRQNDFYAQLANLFPGHHYDHIQLWVQTDATQNSRNISIVENNLYDLIGAVHPQGIFGRGDYVDANGVPNPYGFENVLIAHNLIVTQHSNAISITEAQGLTIHDNTLVYGGDYALNPEAVNVPGIRYSLSSDVAVYNNILPNKYGYPAADTAEFYHNTLYNVADGSLAGLLVNPYALTPDRMSYASLPVAAVRNADGTLRGAFSLQANGQQATPLFDFGMRVVEGQYSYRFDAGLSLPATGGDWSGAQFIWHFADGTQLEGRVVERSFSQAGLQDVRLTIIDSQGQTNTFTKHRLTVLDSTVLTYDFEQGIVDGSANSSSLQTTTQLQTVSGVDGGSAIVIGGTNGHLYLPPTDPDLGQLAATQQLTVAMHLQALASENSALMVLAAEHGVWSVGIIPSTGQIQVSVSGQFYRFSPGVNLLDGSWNHVAMSFTASGMNFFVNGVRVHQIALTAAQTEPVFTTGAYGLGIGGTGPWYSTSSSIRFNIDNLYVSTLALTDELAQTLA